MLQLKMFDFMLKMLKNYTFNSYGDFLPAPPNCFFRLLKPSPLCIWISLYIWFSQRYMPHTRFLLSMSTLTPTRFCIIQLFETFYMHRSPLYKVWNGNGIKNQIQKTIMWGWTLIIHEVLLCLKRMLRVSVVCLC